jgi:uncharacterized OB-fold protein
MSVQFRAEFPLPDVEWEPTRPFFAGAARGELILPRCAGCARYVWYPDGACRRCQSTERAWTAVSGRGRLFSWAVVHRAFIPHFAADVPYVTALVAVEEDPDVRLATRLVDCDPAALRIDLPVRAVFRPLRVAGIDREVVVPFFTPAEKG